MIDRIKQLIEAKQLSSSQFADGIEVPRAIVSHILSGRNKPSLDVVTRILDVHRDVRMDWLLLGEGTMLKTLAAASAAIPEAPEPAKAASIPVPEAVAPEKPVEKVQSQKAAQPDVSAAKPTGRAIERIIIFYTDKTFDTYSPL